jgi:hypothetical protein
MGLSTHTPERLQRLRESQPPTFDEWAARVGFSAAFVTFLEQLTDAHGSDLIADLCDGELSRESTRRRYLALRDEAFVAYWHSLDEDQK